LDDGERPVATRASSIFIFLARKTPFFFAEGGKKAALGEEKKAISKKGAKRLGPIISLKKKEEMIGQFSKKRGDYQERRVRKRGHKGDLGEKNGSKPPTPGKTDDDLAKREGKIGARKGEKAVI